MPGKPVQLAPNPSRFEAPQKYLRCKARALNADRPRLAPIGRSGNRSAINYRSLFDVASGAFVMAGSLWLALRLLDRSISSLMATILNSPIPDRHSVFKTTKTILPKSSFVRDLTQAVPSVFARWFA
ncbi:MAG: hypothetical protein ACI87E_005109 [Mariniblastus sp.]|jgi:hypothetical protein